MFKRILLITSITLFTLSCDKNLPDGHYQNALNLISENNYAAAIIELRNAVKSTPSIAKYRLELSKAYIHQKQFLSAEKELKKALELGQPLHEVLPYLAIILNKNNKLVELSELNLNSPQLSPEEKAKIGFFKTKALTALKEDKKANDVINKIALLETTSLYKAMTSSFIDIIAHNEQIAANSLALLYQNNPDNEHLLQLQVTVLTKLDQPELLIIKLKQLLSIKSETTANQVLLVNLLVFKKEFEEANTFSKSLLTKYPNNTQLLQLQATIDIQLGLFSDALKHSKQAIAYGDNTTSTQVIVGIAAYQQGRFDEANHHLKSVINEYADNDELLSILAHTYLKIGQSYQASKLVQLISYDNTNKNNLVNATSYELIKQGYTTQAKKLIESNENTLKNDNDKYLSSNIKLLLQDFSAIPELENQHDDTNSNETKKAALTSAYIANGDLQKAELYAKKWQQTSPHKIEPLLFLSLIAQKNNQYARARDFLQQALVIDNKNIDVIIALVNLNIKTDNLQDAKKQISKLVQENPTYLPALTTFFDVFRDSSLSKDAMLPILKFQKQQPKNISVTLLVAQMYFQLKEYDTSLQQIENLKVLTKYLPLAAKKIKGEALITIGQYEKAENHYKDWIKEQPYNKASILGLLNVYDSLNKFQQGILVLDNYLKEVSDPFLLSFKAYFLIQTGNREASKNILKELSKKERDKAFVKGIQARIYIAESKYNKALPLAKIAYENIPSQKNLISVVMSQEKLADHESAIKMLETHTSKYKNDIIALLILAERRLDKNTLQSQKLYQQVIVIEPKNIIALNNLANIYLQANQLNKAESLLHEVLAISPNYTASIDSLAQIRTLTGDHQAALLLLQKAYQLAPNDSTLLLNYISSMIDNNKIKLARRYLEKVKEKYPRLMKKSNEISERLEHL